MEFFADLHPKFVHFTIALFSTYILFEIIFLLFNKDWLNKSTHLILILGVLLTIGTVLTGNQAEQNLGETIEKEMPHINKVLDEHEDYGTLVLWFFTAIALFRTSFFLKKRMTKKIQIIFVLLAVIGGYLIYETGEYGGKLVYKYGVGTELFKGN